LLVGPESFIQRLGIIIKGIFPATAQMHIARFGKRSRTACDE
jgi:hypothetical protein